MDEIGPGSLLWAWVTDRGGRRTRRPCVVIKRWPRKTGQMTPESFTVMAVSTDQELSAPEDRIEMPFSPGGHPMTGLKQRCWAVASWVERIEWSDLEPYKGKRLPMDVLERIVERMNQRAKRLG